MDTDETMGSFNLGVSADPRDGPTDDWQDWEQSRTRTFLDPTVDNTDDEGNLGQYRNIRLELVKTRDGAGFKASWKFSIETKLTKYHISQDGLLKVRIIAKTKTVATATLNGLATHCHDWTSQTWQGELPPEAFETVDDLKVTNANVPIRKC
jgi:hypothetical protein